MSSKVEHYADKIISSVCDEKGNESTVIYTSDENGSPMIKVAVIKGLDSED